jgi:hypothetical protein
MLLAPGLMAALGCDGPVESPVDGPIGDPLGTDADPRESTCAPRALAPPRAETLRAQGLDIGFEPRDEDPDEVDGGLVFEDLAPTLEPAAPSLGATPLWNAAAADSDRDCLADAAETAAGTSPTNPDTDGDGWFDGPCNERRKLFVVSLKAWDEQEDLGVDETYLIVDDTRFPATDNLDGYWDFDDGQSRALNLLLASRVRGTNVTGSLATARVEGWEDDVELTNTWWVDDSLFVTNVNLGAQVPGATFKVRRAGDSYDYELTLRVDVEKFADPTPTANADKDLDGIMESAEFAVSRDMGGIADPARKEVFVELDAMPNRKLETRSRRLVTTRLATKGLNLQVRTGEQLVEDLCLTRTEARSLFDTKFQNKTYKAFRYAVMSNVIWNDASGVAIGDTFFVDDSTWWISGGVLAQAGTFIHELGHTLGLTKDVFRLIDSVASPFYDSAMNYLYQATKVDYSHDGAGGDTNDHNDWRVVDPAVGLRASFGNARNLADDGVCAGK